jgi:hypothetical protein
MSDDGINWREVTRDDGVPPYTHPTHDAVWLGDVIIGAHQYVDALFESSDGGATWVRTHPFSHQEEIGPHHLFVHDDLVIATGGGLWIGTLG